MKRLSLLLACVLIGSLATLYAQAQIPPFQQSCSDNTPSPFGSTGDGCAPHVNDLSPGQFQATPFVDGCPNGICQAYGNTGNIVSLYGSYGNFETSGAALTHYTQGTDLASQFIPLCTDGLTDCPDADRAIVFLFLGFSNCDIEICGGNSNAWDGQEQPQNRLTGQPCSTKCRNLHYPNGGNAWNDAGDQIIQYSFLYQLYHDPLNPVVGSHVVVFNGALGQQTLNKWDPTSNGWFWNNNDCDWDYNNNYNPECNYYRVKSDLQFNGFSEKQVQAIFLKSGDSYPQCDLQGNYCTAGYIPDAYQQEIYLGDILRYLKCCTLDNQHHSTGIKRYPNLLQVFITSRIYGGYANGQPAGHNCLMPEPFAYEEGFAVQRSIVAQIDRNTVDYAGDVRYPESAPWVDWGPYLWASGETPRNFDQLNWCNGQNDQLCSLNQRDVRYGDLVNPGFWGDFTHPAAAGLKKVADKLVKFVSGTTVSPFVSGWIGK